jgi:hypothetical protein
MADSYGAAAPGPGEPYVGAVAINYSSDQTVSGYARGLLISTAGTLKVDTARGDLGVSLILAVGVYNIAITKIYNSGSSNAVGFILF